MNKVQWTRLEDKVLPDFQRKPQRPSLDESRASTASEVNNPARMFGDLGNLFEGLYGLSLRDPVLRVALRFLGRTCWYLFDRHVRRPEGLMHCENRVFSWVHDLALACHAPGATSFTRACYRDFDGNNGMQTRFASTLVATDLILRALGWYAGHGLIVVRNLTVACRTARRTMSDVVLPNERLDIYFTDGKDSLLESLFSNFVESKVLAFSEGLLMAGRPDSLPFPLFRLGAEYTVRRFIGRSLPKIVSLQRLQVVLTWLERTQFIKYAGRSELQALLFATATTEDFDWLSARLPRTEEYVTEYLVYHVGRTTDERVLLTERKLALLRASGHRFQIRFTSCLYELFHNATEATIEWFFNNHFSPSLRQYATFTAWVQTTLVVMSRPLCIPPNRLAFTVRRVAFLLRWLQRWAECRHPDSLHVGEIHAAVRNVASRLLGLLARCQEAFESGASVDRNDVPAVMQLLLSLAYEARPVNPHSGRSGACYVLIETGQVHFFAHLGYVPWLRIVPYRADETIWSDLATLLSDHTRSSDELTFFLNERPLASHAMGIGVAPVPEVVETFVHALTRLGNDSLQRLLSWWQINNYERLRALGTWRRDMLLVPPRADFSLVEAICKTFFDIRVTLEPCAVS